jgi:hypothetical protein
MIIWFFPSQFLIGYDPSPQKHANAIFRLIGSLLLKESLGRFDRPFLETLGAVMWFGSRWRD